MSKILLIAEHHLRQEVLTRGFLITLLSLPLFLALIIGSGWLAATLETAQTRVGFVDPTGAINAQMAVAVSTGDLEMIGFASPEAARAALDAGSIQAYYVFITAEGQYQTARKAELYFYTPPPPRAHSVFTDLIRRSLLDAQPPEISARALEGSNLHVKVLAAKRTFAAGGPTIDVAIPPLFGLLFAFLVMTSAGTLMSILVQEKANRTIEIITTAASTQQMMAGKILASLGIGVILLLAWVTMLFLIVWIGRDIAGLSWLQDLQPNWRDLGLLVLVAIPAFLCMAAFMTAIGATLVEEQEAQQIGPFMLLGMILPIYFFFLFASEPNGLLALALSFFPLTAVMSLALRSIFIELPLWQIAAAAGTSLVFALGMIWLAGQAVRLSMLRYGQRLRLHELIRRKPR